MMENVANFREILILLLGNSYFACPAGTLSVQQFDKTFTHF